MREFPRRVVTGHDESGKSIVISDGQPPQHHEMKGLAVGADFFEMWGDSNLVPMLTSVPDREPNERAFTIMPATGHLIRVLDVYPPKDGGKRTVMHRTKTIDYAVIIEGEIVLGRQRGCPKAGRFGRSTWNQSRLGEQV